MCGLWRAGLMREAAGKNVGLHAAAEHCTMQLPVVCRRTLQTGLGVALVSQNAAVVQSLVAAQVSPTAFLQVVSHRVLLHQSFEEHWEPKPSLVCMAVTVSASH